jgi:hypothetical protein
MTCGLCFVGVFVDYHNSLRWPAQRMGMFVVFAEKVHKD